MTGEYFLYALLGLLPAIVLAIVGAASYKNHPSGAKSILLFAGIYTLVSVSVCAMCAV